MSRIFKANSVQIDQNNRVIVDANNFDFRNNKDEYIPKIEDEYDYKESDIEEFSENLIENARNQSKNILDEAHFEANNIIENAKIEAETTYSERFNQGYENGYNEGKEQAFSDMLNETNQMKEEAVHILENAKNEKEELLNSVEPKIVDLVYTIVEDLIKTEMKYDASLVLALVKEGLSNTTILEKVTIKLSEVDYDLVVEKRDELEKLIDSSKELKIIKDFTLENNDCIIETDFGYVNCSIDEKLKTLKKNLELILSNR